MYKSVLYPGFVYHVYNRAHGSELMFEDHSNYQFFLDRYIKHINMVSECICYCLMPNHFHILLRIRDVNIVETVMGIVAEDHLNEEVMDKLLIKKFSNFFNSYAKSFNKQQGRKGSLFMHSFRRKMVKDQLYLRKLIHYIHRNPVEAGLVDRPEQWEYSSYRTLVFNDGESKLRMDRRTIMEAYDNLDDFIAFHNQSSAFELIDNL